MTRIDLGRAAPQPYAAMIALEESIDVDRSLRGLLKLRASQINGCALCIDMHWKDARVAGESEERLYSLDAWHESPLYNERERAGLALCEAMTRITDGHVPDPVWEQAAAVFDEKELGHIVFVVATINTWNRLAITSRATPGRYQPKTTAA